MGARLQCRGTVRGVMETRRLGDQIMPDQAGLDHTLETVRRAFPLREGWQSRSSPRSRLQLLQDGKKGH